MKFEADGQFYYALISVAAGYLCGLITFLFECQSVFKSVVPKIIFSGIRGFLLAAGFVIIKFLCGFPDLRFYMVLCFFIGFIVYKKTIAKVIAKFAEKIYNICIKNLTKWRKRINDTREKKKNSRRKHGGNGIVTVHSFSGHDISNGKHFRKKGKNRTTRQANRSA